MKKLCIASILAAAMLLTGCGENDESSEQPQEGNSDSLSLNGDTASEQNTSETTLEEKKLEAMDMFDFLPEIPVTDASKFEYRVEQDGVIITDFLTDDAAVRIPDTIEGKPVTALRLNESVTVYHHGESFDDIPEYKKYNITELILPDTVRAISASSSTFDYYEGSDAPYRATADAPALDKVEYMNYPAELSSCDCYLASLKKLYIDENTSAYLSHQLRFGDKLTEAYIPTTMTAFSSTGFLSYDDYWGSNSETFDLTDSIRVYYNGKIYNGYTNELHHLINDINGDGFAVKDGCLVAFYSDREDAVIPDEVTSINNNAFSGCDNLKAVKIPANVESIHRADRDGGCFDGCDNLTAVTFEEGSKLEYLFGFDDCPNLRSINIPDSVTSIGDIGNGLCGDQSAFANCTSLRSITIPDSVTQIICGSFSGCTSLTSVTIPDSVTEIGENVFSGCTNLNSVTIGSGVTYIDESAFKDCPNLTSFTFRGKTYDSIDDVIQASRLDENGMRIENGVLLETSSDLTKVVIPNTVTKIGGEAFKDCTSLRSVTIPDSVASIGGSAFSGCTSLRSITIPNSVTELGTWAFSGCTSLTSVTISDSLTQINFNAFSGCENLSEVKLGSGVGKNVNLVSLFLPYADVDTYAYGGDPNWWYDSWDWYGGAYCSVGVMTGDLGKRIYFSDFNERGMAHLYRESTMVTFGTRGKNDVISYCECGESYVFGTETSATYGWGTSRSYRDYYKNETYYSDVHSSVTSTISEDGEISEAPEESTETYTHNDEEISKAQFEAVAIVKYFENIDDDHIIYTINKSLAELTSADLCEIAAYLVD